MSSPSLPSADTPHRPAPLRQRARAPGDAELEMIPWLGLLDAVERERVVAALQVVEADPGDFVCKIGRQANYWFGVLDGLLKMSNDSSLGFAITFTGVPPGAWFGEGTLLKREVYRYNIEALRKSTVAGLPIEVFWRLLEREAAWLPSLVFVIFLAPARILTGWAYSRALRRGTPRHWFLRLMGRVAIIPTALLYVLIVFLAQYTSWNGSVSLYEQHAFLVPVPFLNL